MLNFVTCKIKGICNYKCPRRYSDPDARWGGIVIMNRFLWYGAMDNYATYRLLNKSGIIPYIPLDTNARIDYVKPYPDILCFDDDETLFA